MVTPLFFDLIEIGEEERMTEMKKDGKKEPNVRQSDSRCNKLFLRMKKK